MKLCLRQHPPHNSHLISLVLQSTQYYRAPATSIRARDTNARKARAANPLPLATIIPASVKLAGKVGTARKVSQRFAIAKLNFPIQWNIIYKKLNVFPSSSHLSQGTHSRILHCEWMSKSKTCEACQVLGKLWKLVLFATKDQEAQGKIRLYIAITKSACILWKLRRACLAFLNF